MRKTLIIKLSLTFIILIILSYQVFARVWANESCSAFYYGCNTGLGGTSQSTGLSYTSTIQNLGQLIAAGAGYFASSQSDYLVFVNKIEMSDLQGVDYKGLRESLLLSMENIEKAILIYPDIIATADKTPYNPDIIKKLEMFDYLGFQNKKSLNGIIFGKAADYLKKGDVRGTYMALYKEMESISTQLIAVKSMVDQNQFPEMATVWQVNQMYAELMLFGQYISQVFYEIRG